MNELPPPQAAPQGCVALPRSRAAPALAPQPAPAGAGRRSGRNGERRAGAATSGPATALPLRAGARR